MCDLTQHRVECAACPLRVSTMPPTMRKSRHNLIYCALRAIMRIRSDAPIVGLTSSAAPDVPTETGDATCSPVLTPPFRNMTWQRRDLA